MFRLVQGSSRFAARSSGVAPFASARFLGSGKKEVPPVTGFHLTADYIDFTYDASDTEIGPKLTQAMAAAVTRQGMTVMHTHCHVFDASETRPGFTAVVLINESHCTAHCYQDAGQLALDIFTCGSANTAAALDEVHEVIKSTLAPTAKKVAGDELIRFKKV